MLAVSSMPLIPRRLLVAIGIVFAALGLDSLNIRAGRPIPEATVKMGSDLRLR